MDTSRGEKEDGSFICYAEEGNVNNRLGNGVTVVADEVNVAQSVTEEQSAMSERNDISCPLIILNDEDEVLFTGNGLSNPVAGSVASVCSSICQEKKVQDVLDTAFYSMDLAEDGRVKVSKVLEYIKLNVDNTNEIETALEDLWFMFDQNKEDVNVDVETFREVMSQWVNQLQQNTSTSLLSVDDSSLNLISFHSRSSSPLSSSPIPSRQSSFGLIDHSLLFNCTFGSLEGIGGDVSQHDHLELTAELKEMHHRNNRLTEKLVKLENQISVTEEHNTVLAEEKSELNKRLSCYQSSLSKSKELEVANTELNNRFLKCESENTCLQKRIDELKKEISTLETRIQSMNEDLANVFSDADQLKLSKECLQQELRDLNIKIEHLELTLETKEMKLQEATIKSQDNELLAFYWRTKFEESTADKDKLEMELSKAQQDIEELKKRVALSLEFKRMEEMKISDTQETPLKDKTEPVVNSHINFTCMNSLQSLSIRQEMEGLLGEDESLPTPFCEKVAGLRQNQEVLLDCSATDLHLNKNNCCSKLYLLYSEMHGEDGDEGVVDDSDEELIVPTRTDVSRNSPEITSRLQNQMALALKLVLACRRDTTSLLTFCQQFKTEPVLRSSSRPYISGIARPVGCGDVKTTYKYRTSKSESLVTSQTKDLLSLIDVSEFELENSVFLPEDQDTNDDLGIIKEIKSLQEDLCQCRDILTVNKSVADVQRGKVYFSKSIWGKTMKFINSDSSSEENKRQQGLENTSTPCRISPSDSDIYQRLITTIKYRNPGIDVTSFEGQFYQLMLTIIERRASLNKRMQFRQNERAVAAEHVDKELKRLKTRFKSANLMNSHSEEQLSAIEQMISNLSHEHEVYGALQEEMTTYSFVDNIIHYFENVCLHCDEGLSNNKESAIEYTLAHNQNLQTSESSLSSSTVQSQKIDTRDSSTQCNISAVQVQDIEGPQIEESTPPTNPQFSRFCRAFHCWKAKLCDVLWSLASDTTTTLNSYTIIGMIAVILLGTVMYCVLSFGNSCPQCTPAFNDAAYGKSWSEILRPHVEQQHPPHIF